MDEKAAKYRVGVAGNPQPEDKWYGYEEAVAHAGKWADTDFNLPVAIWDERCDIVSLYFCGQEFKPAA